MESAFGVDHGDEVSKGLPSALRAKSGFKIGGGTFSVKRVAAEQRVAQHNSGRAAAKNFGEAKRLGYEPPPSMHNDAVTRGQKNVSDGMWWKRRSKQTMEPTRPWAKKKKVLP